MMRMTNLLFLICFVNVLSYAFEFRDGLEGPWVQPDGVFNPAFEGDGFDEDWFVSNVNWVGPEQFNMIAEEEIKTEGEYSQTVNAYWANGAPRDFYAARHVEGLQPGAAYLVSLDWRFDRGTSDHSNYIQYDVRSGDHRSQEQVADIEDYGGHPRPDTTIISDDRIGSGAFHTIKREFVAEGGSLTFMMIVRFAHLDETKGFAEPFDENWLYLDNFVVATFETTVSDWSVY